MNAVIPQDLLSAVAKISGTTDIAAFQNTMISTLFPNKGANVSINEVTAFLMVAKEYNLNPITKEIYAFPNRGGIQPIVSIDGWLKIINSHPQFDGMEFVDNKDDSGSLTSVTCRIFRKDRTHSTEMTEYMDECRMPKSDAWAKYPARMLRHKATIQAARYAFGFSGIVDEDEAQRIAPSPNDIEARAEMVIGNKKIEEIEQLIAETGSDTAAFLAWVGSAKISDMTDKQYEKAKVALMRKSSEKNQNMHTQIAEGEEIEI